MRVNTLFLVFLILFITQLSCKKDIKVNSLEEVLLNVSPARQDYTIDPFEGKLLTAAKGTVIYIPENAFQFEDGSIPERSIQLKIKECYELAEMIAENLSTRSENAILETGGMIYISAVSEGKSLEIQDGKAIAVGFPKGNATKEMDLFYDFRVNDSVKTWIPDYQISEAENSLKKVEDTLLTESLPDEEKYPIKISEDLYDYRLCVAGGSWSIWELQFKTQGTSLIEYFQNLPVQSDSLLRLLEKENWYLELETNIDRNGKALWQRKDYSNHYEFDADVDWNKWKKMKPRKSYYTHPKLRQGILKYINSAPDFDVNKYKLENPLEPRQASIHDYKQELTLGVCKDVNEERYKKKFRDQYSQYTNAAVQQMDQDVLDHYMFSSTKLGWINCDRFWDLADSKKTDYVVRTKNPKDTKVQLIFKDIKSILNGIEENGTIVFREVPLNYQIKIIGISYQNGKPTMATRETVIDTIGTDLDIFKEFTLMQLKSELNQ